MRRGRHERDSYHDGGITAVIALTVILAIAAVVDGSTDPEPWQPVPPVHTGPDIIIPDRVVEPVPTMPERSDYMHGITTTTEAPTLRDIVRDVFGDHYWWAETVINCESEFNPDAYNRSSGAAGLWQFIPSTWEWASDEAGWAGSSP